MLDTIPIDRTSLRICTYRHNSGAWRTRANPIRLMSVRCDPMLREPHLFRRHFLNWISFLFFVTQKYELQSAVLKSKWKLIFWNVSSTVSWSHELSIYFSAFIIRFFIPFLVSCCLLFKRFSSWGACSEVGTGAVWFVHSETMFWLEPRPGQPWRVPFIRGRRVSTGPVWTKH